MEDEDEYYSDDDNYSYTYSDNDDDEEEVENEAMEDYEYNEDEESEDDYDGNNPSMDVDEEEAQTKSETTTSRNRNRLSMSNPHTPSSDMKKDSPIRMTSAAQLMPLMKARIDEVVNVFNLSPAAAHVLLRKFKWSKDRLCEMLMDNPEKLVKDAGILARYQRDMFSDNTCTTITTATNTTTRGGGVMTRKQQSEQFRTCNICMDDELTPDEMIQMPCSHEFCSDCWKSFLATMVKDGPTCIRSATCPQDKCNETITEEEVKLISPELLPKYETFQLRSFVELNGTSRWCPGPGCERVATLANEARCNPCSTSSTFFTDSTTIIATCDDCSTSFCLKCGEEPHAPLVCKELAKWHEKCRNESETANWILANTKPCAKCGSRIEKNQGCNHMTCQQCGFEFCWICGGNWHEHGTNTGGYYRCNKFETKKDSEEDQSDVAKAKRELDRYLHYYKRYHAHTEAQSFAKKQLKETEARMILLQESNDNATWTDVEFLKSANEQLVECRRVLKYTYCFAFYMPERDGGQKEKTDTVNAKFEMQKDRFEYHQSMLERFTEVLSELVEKPLPEINRENVVNQTRVVKNFMKNILQYVEEGMD